MYLCESGNMLSTVGGDWFNEDGWQCMSNNRGHPGGLKNKSIIDEDAPKKCIWRKINKRHTPVRAHSLIHSFVHHTNFESAQPTLNVVGISYEHHLVFWGALPLYTPILGIVATSESIDTINSYLCKQSMLSTLPMLSRIAIRHYNRRKQLPPPPKKYKQKNLSPNFL